MENERLQVNVDFSNHPELYDALKQYVEAHDTDASKFIRRLVRRAMEREQRKQVAAVPQT